MVQVRKRAALGATAASRAIAAFDRLDGDDTHYAQKVLGWTVPGDRELALIGAFDGVRRPSPGLGRRPHRLNRCMRLRVDAGFGPVKRPS